MRQRPNPSTDLWKSSDRLENAFINKPVGAFTPPVGPGTFNLQYSDSTIVEYSDGTDMEYA